jgi:hypothetical protein
VKKLVSVAALLGSTATIACCFLPALFVALGAGAAFASLVGAFPGLVWLSEHKAWVFGAAGALLILAVVFQRRASTTACPIDPKLAESCRTAKSWSRPVLFAALFLYLLGFAFAFVLPRLTA